MWAALVWWRRANDPKKERKKKQDRTKKGWNGFDWPKLKVLNSFLEKNQEDLGR